MIKLIIFYVLFVAYIVVAIKYISSQVRRYKTENTTYSQEELEIDFRSVWLNVLLLTTLITIVSFVLIFSDINKQNITPGQIGIILASGTIIFYVAFLLWDVMKFKIKDYFISKYGIELKKDTLMCHHVVLSIILFSILILILVLSIIYLCK